jgi:WD40 repeat protein
MTKQSVFTTGGTVQAGPGIYLRRPADEDLLRRCRQGYLTYVLTPRQMGKSSLMVETATRLQEEGIRCVIIDLTALGVHGTGPEQWYLGLLTLIEEQLNLSTDVVSWWQDYQHLSLTQRMTKFIQEVLLVEVQKQVVIFVDEIDSTLSLNFTDDFFAAIRYLYVTRAYEENLKRLSFVLIGVATPGDLISDPQRTPFNIGQRVDLNDFTLAEMMPLQDEIAKKLNLSTGQIKQLMTKVLYWTGGHPYLTQRLCASLLENGSVKVDKIVKKIFLEQLSQQDNNLQFVRDMLTKRTPNPDEILRIYQEIRCGKIVKNEEQSLVHSHLKLSGVVRQQGNRLVVRNRIYYTVFDRQWIWNSWSDNFWKRYLPIFKWAIPLTIVTTATLIGIPITAQWYRDIQQRTVDQLFAVAHDKFTSHPIDAAIDVLAAYRKIKTSSIPFINISVPTSAHETLSDIILNLRESNRLQRDSGVSSVAFSPDRKTIINGDREGNIQILDIKQGSTISIRKAHKQAIYSVAFSPDGKIIASASTDQMIKLWNAENGKQIGNELKGHNGEIYSVAFSPDGKTIASGSLDKTISLWNVKTQRMIKSFEGHTDAVFSVAFSPDGENIASGSWDNTVRLWNARNGKQLIKPIEHPSRVYSVAYSPKDKTIASACKDKKIRLWSTKNGQQIGAPFLGHKSNIYSVSFSDDGEKIVSGSWDHTVRLWNVKTQQQIDESFSHDNVVYSVAFKGKTIISGSLDKTLRLWDTNNKRSDKSVKTLKNHKDSIYTVAFSPDGKKIVSGSWDKTIRLWDARKGEQIGKEFEGHNSIVFTVAFSPDGKTIISGDRGGNIKIWDAVTHKPISKPFLGHEDAVYAVAFSPDGKKVVSGSWDKTIRLWNAETGKQTGAPLTGHTGPIYTVAVSPNSKIIVSSGNDKTIRLWSAETGAPIGLPLIGHQDTVHSVAVSPDGKTIVSSGLDQTIRLWNIEKAKLLLAVIGIK